MFISVACCIVFLVAVATAQQTGPVSTQVPPTTPAQLCPAMLSSEDVLVKECRTEGVVVSCAQPMQVGTTVVLTCGEGLITSSNSTTWSRTCELNGEWTEQQTTCRPLAYDCGNRVVKEVSVSGETVTSEQPWLIVIYRRKSPSSTYRTTNLIGTLISTTHVVTSALGVSDYGRTAYPASQLRLIAGKYLEDSNMPERNSQWRNVTSVIRHGQFDYDNLLHNIALLVAGEPFTVSWDVNIACVDWSGLLQAPTPGQRVLTAGWRRGVNTSREVIASQPVVFVSHEECRTSADEDDRRYVSADDLCIRTPTNSTCFNMYVSNGGGLLVERTTGRGARFFLEGVLRFHLASTFVIVDRCFYNVLNSYTSVSNHASWIKRHIDL